MKIAILLLVTLTYSVLAADEKPPVLQTREYKLPPGFLDWIEQASPPRKTAEERDPKAPRQEQCYGFFGDWAEGVFTSGATATFLPGHNLIVVRHTPTFLDAWGKLVAQCQKHGLRSQPDPKLVKVLKAEGFSLYRVYYKE